MWALAGSRRSEDQSDSPFPVAMSLTASLLPVTGDTYQICGELTALTGS